MHKIWQVKEDHSYLWSGFQNTHFFLQQSAFWLFKVVHGHPRSIILVPIESAYTTSY